MCFADIEAKSFLSSGVFLLVPWFEVAATGSPCEGACIGQFHLS